MMVKAGRRTLYVYGLLVLFIVVLVIGIMGTPAETTSLSWAIGSLLLIYTFTCKFLSSIPSRQEAVAF